MKWIVKLVIEWLLERLASLGAYLYEVFKLKKRQDKRTSLAEEAKKVEEEIKALVREGKPVPKELEEKLREYNRRLADSIESYELH